MSDPEQRAPWRRAIAALTGAGGRALTRVSVRERASKRASSRGRALIQASARGRAPVDPRVDGILQTIKTLGNVVGQQAQNQVVAAATAANVATTVTALAEVPPGNGNGERLMHKLVEYFLRLELLKFTEAGDPEAATLWVQELEKAFALLRCSEEDNVTLARFRQNHMTVDQYEARFAKLSKYAPRLIEDLVDRARRFKDGLKLEIKDLLVPLNLKDYDELYERA
ncbi:hypothetical protein ACJRO7_030094 [Eucalyptus globulus]|uniref:Retrotransposon gag domain-containing protein n=1 Tax=Eucalyptus globulus TaxID=34317 RepID=A0ABD3JN90_EUCGL